MVCYDSVFIKLLYKIYPSLKEKIWEFMAWYQNYNTGKFGLNFHSKLATETF